MGTLIQTLIEDQTALWTLNHPPVNALSKKLLEKLDLLVDQANADPNIRTVVLASGLQTYFAAGADIRELQQISNKAEGKKYAERGQEILQKIESASKPFIAAVEGFCLGGGFELALACHFRIAGTEAHLGLPEVNLGLIPGFGGIQRLAGKLTSDRALHLMLTGKHLPAEEALEQGLVTQTVKAGSALDTALSLARQIQTKGPLSVAAILASVYGRKRESLQKPYQNDTQAFGALFETEDTREGIQAFLQKRLPQFKGR